MMALAGRLVTDLGKDVYGPASVADGQPYPFSGRTDVAFDGVNDQAAFAPPAALWSIVRLPLVAFLPPFRGRPVPSAPPLDSARVRQIGFLIAARPVGAFALVIRSIHLA